MIHPAMIAMLRPVTKDAVRVDSASEIYPALRGAFQLARSGVPGPVAVELPAQLFLLETLAQLAVNRPDLLVITGQGSKARLHLGNHVHSCLQIADLRAVIRDLAFERRNLDIRLVKRNLDLLEHRVI